MSDFVFRERAGGKLEFVGDFEGLYSAEIDPWGQSARSGPMASYYRRSRARLCEAVYTHDRTGVRARGLEIGCGHGHVLAVLRRDCFENWDGIDISAAAVCEARRQAPGARFFVGDIAGEMPLPPSSVGSYDVVILSQLLWYVLARLDSAVGNAARLVRLGGLLIVSQAFLKGPQRYGSKIADGFNGSLCLFLKRYTYLQIIEAQYDSDPALSHNDGLLVFRKTAHE